jgi:hypothetical protein
MLTILGLRVYTQYDVKRKRCQKQVLSQKLRWYDTRTLHVRWLVACDVNGFQLT